MNPPTRGLSVINYHPTASGPTTLEHLLHVIAQETSSISGGLPNSLPGLQPSNPPTGTALLEALLFDQSQLERSRRAPLPPMAKSLQYQSSGAMPLGIHEIPSAGVA
jgi:hypothetical protein